MHNIMNSQGRAQYLGRQSAWHKLGKTLGRFFTFEEACSYLDMNWDVYKAQLRSPSGLPIPAYGVFRSDTDGFIATVGPNYQPINHIQGFRLADLLVGNKAGAYYETAGLLGTGQVVWGLVNLNEAFSIRGVDTHETYLLFTTSHDGSCAFTFKPTVIRVVCKNTHHVALSQAGQRLRIPHTTQGVASLDTITTMLEESTTSFASYSEALNFLTTRAAQSSLIQDILVDLYPEPKLDTSKSFNHGHEAALTRHRRQIEAVLSAFESADSGAFPEFKGTYYQLLQAITETEDHRTEGAARSAVFGAGAARKARALELIQVAANGAPLANSPRTYSFSDQASSLLDEIAVGR